MKFGNCLAKCPILKGVHQTLDLQTTYRYRDESFRMNSYMKGLQSFVVTWSDLMRFSRNGTANLKIH